MTSRPHQAIETGTGIIWSHWLTILEPHATLDHTALADRALAAIRSEGSSQNPEWWAQNVTVAFEQHIGRRVVGQKCDGSFSGGISKTLPGTMDDVLERITAATEDADTFANTPTSGAPTTSATDKWRYWRVKLADDSRVTITIQTKPGGDKSIAAVNHDKLPSAQVIDERKVWWREFLAAL